MLAQIFSSPQNREAPCNTIRKTTPRDTVSDSWNRFMMLMMNSLSLSRGFCMEHYLNQCLLGISVMVTCALMLQLSCPLLTIVKSDLNSTLPEPFHGYLESFRDTIRSESFNISLDAPDSAEEYEPWIAEVRITRNLSRSPSYRLLWRAATSRDDDFELGIDIVTKNPDIRFYIRRTLLKSFNVSTSRMRPGSPIILLRDAGLWW